MATVSKQPRVAAAALPAVQVNRNVPQFARQATVSLDDPPAVHHAQTQAFADIEHGEISHPLGRPIHLLGQAQGMAFLQHGRVQLQPVAKIGP